jgi:hypothetical protein
VKKRKKYEFKNAVIARRQMFPIYNVKKKKKYKMKNTLMATREKQL